MPTGVVPDTPNLFQPIRANVDTANQQQGADKVTTHIWWDID